MWSLKNRMVSKLTWLCNSGFHKKVRNQERSGFLLLFLFLCVCGLFFFFFFLILYFNVNHLSLLSALAHCLVYVCPSVCQRRWCVVQRPVLVKTWVTQQLGVDLVLKVQFFIWCGFVLVTESTWQHSCFPPPNTPPPGSLVCWLVDWSCVCFIGWSNMTDPVFAWFDDLIWLILCVLDWLI